MKIKSLGHVVLQMADRERAARRYGGVLGLPLCARIDGGGLTWPLLRWHHANSPARQDFQPS